MGLIMLHYEGLVRHYDENVLPIGVYLGRMNAGVF